MVLSAKDLATLLSFGNGFRVRLAEKVLVLQARLVLAFILGDFVELLAELLARDLEIEGFGRFDADVAEPFDVRKTHALAWRDAVEGHRSGLGQDLQIRQPRL